MDMNTTMIAGRLAADPTLKSYKKADGSEGHRCFFRVAVTRLMDRGEKDRSKRRTSFIPVVAWGEAAKRHAQYLAKGTAVIVQGELLVESKQTGTDAQGKAIYREFVALQANDVQYGARSQKNASPADLQTQVTALQNRINQLAAGASAPAPAATLPGSDSDNPFETPAVA